MEQRAAVAVALFFFGSQDVPRHEHAACLKAGCSPLCYLHGISTHTGEQGIEIPFGPEQRAQCGIMLVHVLEILIVALSVRGTRGDLVQDDFAAGVVPVRIVAVRDQDRFHAKGLHAFYIEAVEEPLYRLQRFAIDPLGLVLRHIDLVVYLVEMRLESLHEHRVPLHPVGGQLAEHQHIPRSPVQQPFAAYRVVFGIHHHLFLDAQQVPEPFLALAVDLHVHRIVAEFHRARVAEYRADPRRRTCLLQVQRAGHRIAVADAEGRMSHPPGFMHPQGQVARAVE